MTTKKLTLATIAGIRETLTQTWRDLANCTGQARIMDPPTNDDGTLTRDAEFTAKRVCYRCPALYDCRAWVLALPEEADPGGICGALTPAQRKNRRHAAPAHARCSRCGQSEHVSRFYANRSSRTGRRSECIDCTTARPTEKRQPREVAS